MKVRESGMPEETYWESLFDVPAILAAVGPPEGAHDAVDFGAGYGTFSIPTAKRVTGVVHALEIDAASITRLEERARSAGISNLRIAARDFVAAGAGLPDASVDYVMLFNVLHHADPVALTREAARILAPAGRLATLHWRTDIVTPRGPDLAIRPDWFQIRNWLETAGLSVDQTEPIILEPYHFGFTAHKPAAPSVQ
jgi:SAM-dependent methyltransferase